MQHPLWNLYPGSHHEPHRGANGNPHQHSYTPAECHPDGIPFFVSLYRPDGIAFFDSVYRAVNIANDQLCTDSFSRTVGNTDDILCSHDISSANNVV